MRRRPMTRQEYEAMRRQRQRQNLIGIGILAVITALIVTAVVLILRPPKAQEDKPVSAVANTVAPVSTDETLEGAQTPEPAVTQAPAVGGENTSGGTLRSVRMRVVGDIMVCDEQLAYA